ncbi:MAG TPA: extensin family protein [Methyloceanibacter sp.]|jgi:hypothetical protein|nr:extensin family protein [Methyloceanibacter sp.]
MLNLVARLSFALLVALPVYARAQTGDVPPPPDRNPMRGKTAEVPPTPALPADAPTVVWTDAQVTAARADCAKVLAGVTLEYETLPPLKEGICGAPAPIRVKSINGVAIEPAATMTCALARGMSAWISKTLQPRAKAILGTQVVKLHNATSYSCRNRYGGEKTPLSEHALANALDISEFVFESGEKVTVLASWPRVVAPDPAMADADTTGSIAQAQPPQTKPVEAVELTKVKASSKTNPFAVTTTAKTNPFVLPTAVAKTPPPKPPAEATAPKRQSPAERKGEFVRMVHDDACQTFGTVLGPEANDAHKDHFHFDMKARRKKVICE